MWKTLTRTLVVLTVATLVIGCPSSTPTEPDDPFSGDPPNVGTNTISTTTGGVDLSIDLGQGNKVAINFENLATITDICAANKPAIIMARYFKADMGWLTPRDKYKEFGFGTNMPANSCRRGHGFSVQTTATKPGMAAGIRFYWLDAANPDGPALATQDFMGDLEWLP